MNEEDTQHQAAPEEALRFESGRQRTYRIVVKGRLETSWSDRLAGLEITPGEVGPSTEATTLQGPIRDQAELSGVLNTLYDLRLPLLSLEVLEEA